MNMTSENMWTSAIRLLRHIYLKMRIPYCKMNGVSIEAANNALLPLVLQAIKEELEK